MNTVYKQMERDWCGEALQPQVIAPADNLPFHNLDYILSSHVLEHCYDVLGTLQHWESKIKPGGIIFCIVPRMDLCFDKDQTPTTLADLIARVGAKNDTDAHHSFWTDQLVRDIFKWLGWRIHYMESPDLKAGNGVCFVYKKPH
jgi:predicted SAM-dependent methyltransferase